MAERRFTAPVEMETHPAETPAERDTAGGWYCNHPECDCRDERDEDEDDV